MFENDGYFTDYLDEIIAEKGGLMNLLTTYQVCQKLQIKQSYLYHLTHTKQIPFIRLGGGKKGNLRFDQEDINAWLVKNKENGDEHLQARR